MSPSERLLKAVHMAIDRERPWLDAMPEQTYAIRLTIKPRRDAWRVSINVDKQEESV